jgi:hypothetical protein
MVNGIPNIQGPAGFVDDTVYTLLTINNSTLFTIIACPTQQYQELAE